MHSRAVLHPYVTWTAGAGSSGGAFVEGTRIPIRRIWAWHRGGVSVETIQKRYPAIRPAVLLSALSFAYDNADLLEMELADERAALAAESTRTTLTSAT
jgi:uncharacterized protein (DUF433 family)